MLTQKEYNFIDALYCDCPPPSRTMLPTSTAVAQLLVAYTSLSGL